MATDVTTREHRFCWLWMALFASILATGMARADEDVSLLTLELGQREAHVIAVENGTDADWRVDRVTVSCECLGVEGWPDLVPAGSTGDVMLTVTGKSVGQFVFQVTLYGEMGDSSRRVLQLPVRVVPAADVGATGLHRLQLATRERDHGLYCSAAEVVAAASEIRFMDTRDGKAYQMAHIPGSVRRDAQALRKRPTDASGSVVLVDEGWGMAATERACRRLRESGSGDVHILRGGLAAWVTAGGTVDGIIRGTASLSGLDAEDFLPLAGADDWRMLVYAGQETVGEVSLSDRQVVFLDAAVEDVDTIQSVAHFMDSSDRPVRLLIVDRDGMRGARRADVARAAGADAVFYVSDGAAGLTGEVRFHQQTRLASRQTVTSITIGGKPESTKGGCSGCP